MPAGGFQAPIPAAVLGDSELLGDDGVGDALVFPLSELSDVSPAEPMLSCTILVVVLYFPPLYSAPAGISKYVGLGCLMLAATVALDVLDCVGT